ncbi:MAG: thioredoxin family protein [Gemmatimonadaceae bacterium]
MTSHMTGSREEWLAARLDLLEAEKDLTRRGDEVARSRRKLPWVRVDTAYRFETEAGNVSLAELFKGNSQLLVYHFMFGPEYTAGCPSCSSIADGFNGIFVHLENHDVAFTAVSLAPLETLKEYERRMGWTFPWASSVRSDFNFDYNVSFTTEQQRAGTIEYNYRRGGHAMDDTTIVTGPVAEFAEMSGTNPAAFTRQRPGMSAFALENGVVYHTYSTYGRGVDGIWGMYPWLDRAPKGRNEQGAWWKRHDEYPGALSRV